MLRGDVLSQSMVCYQVLPNICLAAFLLYGWENLDCRKAPLHFQKLSWNWVLFRVLFREDSDGVIAEFSKCVLFFKWSHEFANFIVDFRPYIGISGRVNGKLVICHDIEFINWLLNNIVIIFTAFKVVYFFDTVQQVMLCGFNMKHVDFGRLRFSEPSVDQGAKFVGVSEIDWFVKGVPVFCISWFVFSLDLCLDIW